MLRRPTGVDDEAILRCLRDQWGLEVVAARYLPVGFGSHHWEAASNGARFFVTVDLAGQQDARSAHFDALRAALATASALFQWTFALSR